MIKTLALIIFNFKKIIFGFALIFNDLGRFFVTIADDTLLLPRIMIQMRRLYILIEEHKYIFFSVIVAIIVFILIWKIYFKKDDF